MSSERNRGRRVRRSTGLSFVGLFLLGVTLAQMAVAPALSQTNETESTPAEESVTHLKVAEIATGLDYDPIHKAAVDTASVFAADTEKVICFTRIMGAQSPTQITHVWYHEGQIKAQVKLNVGSPNWRTYSSKRLLPSWTGPWEVKVLDSTGTVLATAAFTIQ